MTAASFSRLPLQAGGVVLASAGRTALWIIAQYMRSPLTNTAIAALVLTSAMAGSNALFGQRHAHPSPLFGTAQSVDKSVAPVVPATRHKQTEAKPVAKATANLMQPVDDATQSVDGPIGNKDVFEVQRKLEMLKLFVGTIDGYYGPQTARAIKKFEEQRGMKPTGMLTREIMDMIASAPLSAPEVRQPAAEPVAPATLQLTPAKVVEPVAEPVAEPVIAPKAVVQPLAALPEPAPLSTDIQTGSIAKTADGASTAPTLLGRPVPQSADEALEMAADTAGDAIDTIISGVQTIAQTKPGKAAALPLAATSKPLEMAARQVEQVEQVADTSTLAVAPTATPGVPLQISDEPADPRTQVAVLDTNATPEELAPAFSVTDPVIVAKVQRGLGSLGFLHGPADGVAGEATAKAIRNFEVYFNYNVTGRISPELIDLLVDNGASI
ncbi:peptidoglycan-binding protein [Devosia sp.]|uniref:peptidoglycan-binding domain-containing protein n=1 Tax=Devosia sp. TaxID=1871048 RepID=UPI003BAC5FA6